MLASVGPARFDSGTRALKSLLAHAMPAWRRLVDDIDAPALIRADGHFVAWETEATHASGRLAWLRADLGAASARDATPAELRWLQSLFAGRPAGALRFEGTGQVVEIKALRDRLAAAFRTAGGTVRQGRAVGIETEGAKASLRLDDGTRRACDLVVLAAGIGSAPLLRPLEGPVPLIAERGYHVETPDGLDSWPADLPPVAFEDRSVIVTRFASTLRLAGFTEFASPTAPPDPRKWDRLDGHADALGLPGAGGRARWIGARPTLPDYLPAIGRSRAAPNLIYAFGHQHLGVTLAAITGELVAATARGLTPAVPLAPFDMRRFA